MGAPCQRTHVLLISGLSCSGKSTLARNLADHLSGEMIRMDDYYFETDQADFASTNFDDPAMIDFELLTRHVSELRSGVPVQSPRYDFVECRYTSFRLIEPTPILIVEGQYTGVNSGLLDLCDLSVYLDVSNEECLERRLQRDCTEFGRTREDSNSRFVERVIPAFDIHRSALMRNSRLHLASDSQRSWMTSVLSALYS